jgi:dUTPase
MRIAQLIITKIKKIKWSEKKKINEQTKRKSSGFGSTGI